MQRHGQRPLPPAAQLRGRGAPVPGQLLAKRHRHGQRRPPGRGAGRAGRRLGRHASLPAHRRREKRRGGLQPAARREPPALRPGFGPERPCTYLPGGIRHRNTASREHQAGARRPAGGHPPERQRPQPRFLRPDGRRAHRAQPLHVRGVQQTLQPLLRDRQPVGLGHPVQADYRRTRHADHGRHPRKLPLRRGRGLRHARHEAGRRTTRHLERDVQRHARRSRGARHAARQPLRDLPRRQSGAAGDEHRRTERLAHEHLCRNSPRLPFRRLRARIGRGGMDRPRTRRETGLGKLETAGAPLLFVGHGLRPGLRHRRPRGRLHAPAERLGGDARTGLRERPQSGHHRLAALCVRPHALPAQGTQPRRSACGGQPEKPLRPSLQRRQGYRRPVALEQRAQTAARQRLRPAGLRPAGRFRNRHDKRPDHQP